MKHFYFLLFFFGITAFFGEKSHAGTFTITPVGTNQLAVIANPALNSTADWQSVGFVFALAPSNVSTTSANANSIDPLTLTSSYALLTFDWVTDWNSASNNTMINGIAYEDQAIIQITANCNCGTGNPTGYTGTWSPPLPLKVKSWDAFLVNHRYHRSNGWDLKPKVTLKLEIESQVNVDRIEILRSSDGLENFETITAFSIKDSTSHNTYAFEDLEPENGINYYTWKSIDYDGKEEYGNLLTVNASYDAEIPEFSNGIIAYKENFDVIEIGSGRVLFNTSSLDVLNSKLPMNFIVQWKTGSKKFGVPRA